MTEEWAEATASRPAVWTKGLLLLVGLAGAAVALPAVGVLGLWEPVRGVVDSVRGAESWGAWGWWGWWGVLVLAGGVLVGGAVLPTHAVSLGMGYVFGMAAGLAGALGAVVIGTVGGWGVAKGLVGGRLRGVVERSEAGRVLVRVLVDGGGNGSRSVWRVVGAVALCRLPPQVPFALGNVVGASVGVRLLAFVVGTVAGMLPRVAAVVWIGSELEQFERGASDWRVVVGGAGLGGVGLLVLGWWAWRVVRRRAGLEAS